MITTAEANAYNPMIHHRTMLRGSVDFRESEPNEQVVSLVSSVCACVCVYVLASASDCAPSPMSSYLPPFTTTTTSDCLVNIMRAIYKTPTLHVNASRVRLHCRARRSHSMLLGWRPSNQLDYTLRTMTFGVVVGAGGGGKLIN